MLQIAIDNSHSFVCQTGTNKAAKNNWCINESDLYVCANVKGFFAMNKKVNLFGENFYICSCYSWCLFLFDTMISVFEEVGNLELS